MSPAVLTFRRAEIEARIEELVALLDFIDGDPDLEEDLDADREPWLGWTESVNQEDRYRMGSTLEPDREENGDEIDSTYAEDEFSGRYW